MGGEKGLRNRCTIKFTGTIQYVDGEVHHPLGQRAHPSYPQSVRHTLRGGGSGVEVTLPPLGSLPSPNALHNGGGGGVERRVFGLEGSYSSKGAPPASRKGGGSPGNSPPCPGRQGWEGGSPGASRRAPSPLSGAPRRGAVSRGGAGPSPGGGGSTLTGFADSISKFNILGWANHDML